jgi:hypothetical protein
MELKKRKDAGAITQIQSLARQRSIQVLTLTKHVMNTLADQRPHQGVLADCSELQYTPVKALPTAEEAMVIAGPRPPLWLALDQVSDPVCYLRKYKCNVSSPKVEPLGYSYGCCGGRTQQFLRVLDIRPRKLLAQVSQSAMLQ